MSLDPFGLLSRASVRLRLTLTYTSLFVVTGAALLGINYLLVSHREHQKDTAVQVICNTQSGNVTQSINGVSRTIFFGAAGCPKVVAGALFVGNASGSESRDGVVTQRSGFSGGVSTSPPPGASQLPAPTKAQIEALGAAVTASENHALNTLVLESGVALALMTLASLGLGWFISGRVLRPVHRITDTARRLSEQTLHDRINLEGPNDELKELADTFDAMLARLDRAFTSQSRFVANASHELRTPLATERVLIDEALANRNASPEDLRAILEQLRLNSEETERLIDALLVLARSERGVEHWTVVDLAAPAHAVLAQVDDEAITAGVEVRHDLHPSNAWGDPGLLERLVGNLVENAVRHNVRGGWLSVSLGSVGGGARLEVTNTGNVLDPDTLPSLLEPFRRTGPDRSATSGGFGLGLSIVDALVAAHGANMTLKARDAGGLHVTVTFPPGRPSDAAAEEQALARI